MRSKFSYAWGKLYLATLALTTGSAPLPERLRVAFAEHLRSLNSQNTPPQIYERVRIIRGKLAQMAAEEVGEDDTINFAPLSEKDAASIAAEFLSLFDEVAKVNARDLGHSGSHTI